MLVSERNPMSTSARYRYPITSRRPLRRRNGCTPPGSSEGKRHRPVRSCGPQRRSCQSGHADAQYQVAHLRQSAGRHAHHARCSERGHRPPAQDSRGRGFRGARLNFVQRSRMASAAAWLPGRTGAEPGRRSCACGTGRILGLVQWPSSFRPQPPPTCLVSSRCATPSASTSLRSPGACSVAAVVTERGVCFGMSRAHVLIARYRGKPIATLALSTRKPWAIDASYFSPTAAPVYLTDISRPSAPSEKKASEQNA